MGISVEAEKFPIISDGVQLAVLVTNYRFWEPPNEASYDNKHHSSC